ncbi:carboxypeptidase M32 [Algicola sagamiensis]|uniref:carboxypeptidase M32 n=1 Tax=Algicola sagamiensis TaxID=163869 RepID=UPI00039D2079|nr:carboxypeptidase M32 [Algicola sagamiensis]
MESIYQSLCKHWQKISRFKYLSALGEWDQATMMPTGASQARAEAMAELQVHVHQLKIQPQLEDWFALAKQEELSHEETLNLQGMYRQWFQATVLPESLVREKTIVTQQCEHAWRTQRKENDWAGFVKNLKQVIALVRTEAQIKADAYSCQPYDAMIDAYEPGMNSAKLASIFAELKNWLPDMIQQVVEKQKSEPRMKPLGKYPIQNQEMLCQSVLSLLPFQLECGRTDTSVHAFSCGIPEDARLTTNFIEEDFKPGLSSLIHEAGHGCYQQNLPKQWRGLPIGEAISMGIHESQSLFFEMQLAKSEPFLRQLLPLMNQHLQTQFGIDELININTRVQPGHIRIYADEMTYPAHIMLRFEIEKSLLDNSLEVDDIPEAWDQKMQSYLGISTKGDFQNGCMQDIHWTFGEFGYFPSYSLGAFYAAQFYAAIVKQTPDLSASISTGNFNPVFEWLKTNIWQKGSLMMPEAIIEKATGEPFNLKYFKLHLESRYLN